MVLHDVLSTGPTANDPDRTSDGIIIEATSKCAKPWFKIDAETGTFGLAQVPQLSAVLTSTHQTAD